MAKYLTIEVTQEDIDNGVSKSATSCPLALAFTRKTKRVVRIGSTIQIWGKAYRGAWDYLLPRETIEFIEDFDSGKPVKPSKFRLKVSE
jgi:hypothetical protein